jgi:serine/threonine protein phosphatase PrpC
MIFRNKIHDKAISDASTITPPADGGQPTAGDASQDAPSQDAPSQEKNSPEGSIAAQTGGMAAGEPVRSAGVGWASREPIVVGRPTLRFEPKQVAVQYRRNPYRPDTVLDGWSTGGFCVRGASVRGYQHRHNGAPRQDDFSISARSNGQQIIAAIADGVSQAVQSHIGSTTAVRYASQWLERKLSESADPIDWKSMIESTAWALVEQAKAIDPACDNAELAENMVATTLVCAVVDAQEDGKFVTDIVTVGDSGAWQLTSSGYTRLVGGKAETDGGVSSSAVSGLPRIPRNVQVTRTVLSENDILLLGTDGFGDPLGGGEGPVGDLFAELLRPGPPSLTEFGHALDFSRETFDDDRTLVAIWRQRPRDAGPRPRP